MPQVVEVQDMFRGCFGRGMAIDCILRRRFVWLFQIPGLERVYDWRPQLVGSLFERLHIDASSILEQDLVQFSVGDRLAGVFNQVLEVGDGDVAAGSIRRRVQPQ